MNNPNDKRNILGLGELYHNTKGGESIQQATVRNILNSGQPISVIVAELATKNEKGVTVLGNYLSTEGFPELGKKVDKDVQFLELVASTIISKNTTLFMQLAEGEGKKEFELAASRVPNHNHGKGLRAGLNKQINQFYSDVPIANLINKQDLSLQQDGSRN